MGHCIRAPGILTVTTPDFTVKLEPDGSGGYLGFCVTTTFGVAEAPPVYLSGVVHETGSPTAEQFPVNADHAICRNTKMDPGAPAAAPAESSTRTENEKVPTVVGFPVVLPPVDSVRPGGRAPACMDHLYGLTPPAATRTTVP
jgi:hypothetical protein